MLDARTDDGWMMTDGRVPRENTSASWPPGGTPRGTPRGSFLRSSAKQVGRGLQGGGPRHRPPARAAAPSGTCSSRLRPAGRRGWGSPGGSPTTPLGVGGAGRLGRARPRLSPTARRPSPAFSRADLGRRCRRGSRHSLRPGCGRRGPRRKLRAEAESRDGAPGEANREDRRTDGRLGRSTRRGVVRSRGRGTKTRGSADFGIGLCSAGRAWRAGFRAEKSRSLDDPGPPPRASFPSTLYVEPVSTFGNSFLWVTHRPPSAWLLLIISYPGSRGHE